MDDDDIVQAFLVESAEGLDELDRDLVALEREPQSRERLTSIFRTVHTIKGTSGFLAYQRLERLTHVGETLLAQLRDGDRYLDSVTTEALLSMVDGIRALLALIERTGTDDDESVQIEQILATLEQLASGEAAEPVAPTITSEPAIPTPVASVAAIPTPATSEPAIPTPVTSVPVAPGVGPPDGPERPAEENTTSSLVDTTVRVDVELLDTLVRLVGELVLTRNQIVQQAGNGTDPELARTAQRLNIVASELQESVMLTRMQPIGQAWTKFPRIVRDLAAQLGKDVRLETFGQETELDRSLLDAIKDPLTHLVRNAIDHGIEAPDARVATGKPAQGVLALRAHHESGQVVVEISDDGKGLDAARIAEVALQRGVVTSTDLARMSERDITDLIFRPGFSTASAVTNVSGRGVGMDVVRTNIERIGGVVDVITRPGEGTTFRVRIPLTLAIVAALLVSEGSERFAIPQASVVELVRLDQMDRSHDIVTVGEATLLRLRDQLLPLVSLSAALGLPEREGQDGTAATVVVVQADSVRFGLTVDAVHDTQEIVVKPLGRQLKALPVYAGATIMGEGRVALILNVAGIAEDLKITANGRAAEGAEHESGEPTTSLLVLDLGGGHRAAMPLAKVSRLEEFSASAIERSGTAEAVQYRDGILPLVRLADHLGLAGLTGMNSQAGEGLTVVVHEDGDRRVGLVAEQILDLVDTVVTASAVGERAGVLGSAVVQDRITDLIDVDAVVALSGASR